MLTVSVQSEDCVDCVPRPGQYQLSPVFMMSCDPPARRHALCAEYSHIITITAAHLCRGCCRLGCRGCSICSRLLTCHCSGRGSTARARGLGRLLGCPAPGPGSPAARHAAGLQVVLQWCGGCSAGLVRDVLRCGTWSRLSGKRWAGHLCSAPRTAGPNMRRSAQLPDSRRAAPPSD